MSDAHDLTKRFLYLRSIPVAAKLPAPVLKILAAALEERAWPSGSVVMRANQPVFALYLLTRGRVVLTRHGALFGELKPPQTLGFLNIIGQSDGSYDAACDGDTQAYALDGDALLDLMEDHYELFEATLRYTAERVYYDMQDLPAEALGSAPDPSPVIPERHMDLIERILLVRAQNGFQEANVNAVAAVCRKFEEVRLEPGTELWKAGDAPEGALMLARGTVACETARGVRFKYGPGTMVGGVDALADRPRWYRAVAETRVQALRGDTAGFLDLLEHDFSLASAFVASLARGLDQILERKAQLGQQPLGMRDVSGLGGAPVGA